MKVNKPELKVVKNTWKPSNNLDRLIGDINPLTAYGLGFKLKQHDTLTYGILNSVFSLKINALDGSRIDYELWVMNIFDNNRQRPSLYDLLMIAFDARELFKQRLADESSANGVRAKLPPFPFAEKDFQRELLQALNDEYPLNGK